MRLSNMKAGQRLSRLPASAFIKPLCLMFFLCISMQSVFSQEYYYYYKGRKQLLQLSTEYIYTVTSTTISDTQKLQQALGNNVTITRFSEDQSARTLKKVTQSDETEYWAEVKLPSPLSKAEYLDYLLKLKKSSVVKIASPYFKNKLENKIGLSHYFYIKLKSDKGYAALERLSKETNTIIVGQNKFMPLWYTLKCTDKSGNALEMANKFYESNLFMYAEPDLMTDDIKATANDPQYNEQWSLSNTGQHSGTAGIDVNAEAAWEITKGSREVVVAVLDHGFEMDHPDLQGNTFGTGFDSESGTTPAQVLGEHGTACAGIVAAIQDNNTGVTGIAPNARIMSVSNSLLGTPTSRQKRADGINWAWQNGAHIISNSWGSGVSYAIIDDAIDNALTNGRGGLGTIIVVSSGNSNTSTVGYPANVNPDIIAVGAMSNCGERKNPSSCDGEDWWGSQYGTALDIVAPGVWMSTTDRQGANGYDPGNYVTNFNGTSSACPLVAGVAALILSVNPCLTHDQVEDIIEQTAQKVGGYAYAVSGGRPNGTWFNEMGYGLVDAQAAVALAQSLLPSAVAFDLYSKDRPFDIGTEPNPDAGPMWISDEIWVRQDLDGGLVHENPEFKLYSPNAVYVKVTNRSTRATSTCANLSLYFTKASTGLVWPTHWSDYFQSTIAAGSTLHGDKINTVLIPALAPGASYIAEFPWFPPNPADFDSDVHHFCLLSRITSPADPMFDEQNGVGVSYNVNRNNNIAWKNISVYDNEALSEGLMSVFIRGVQRDISRINLRFFDGGFQEEIKVPFFKRGGKIIIKTDPELVERMMKDAKLTDIEVVDKGTLLITSPKAQIVGLPLKPKETFSLGVNFSVSLEEREETILDIVQINTKTKALEGGERFIIRNGKQEKGLPIKVAKVNTLAYPNPASSELSVKYKTTSDKSVVKVSIQSATGDQKVVLLNAEKSGGEHIEKVNISSLPRGIYLLTLSIDGEVSTEHIVIE